MSDKLDDELSQLANYLRGQPRLAGYGGYELRVTIGVATVWVHWGLMAWNSRPSVVDYTVTVKWAHHAEFGRWRYRVHDQLFYTREDLLEYICLDRVKARLNIPRGGEVNDGHNA